MWSEQPSNFWDRDPVRRRSVSRREPDAVSDRTDVDESDGRDEEDRTALIYRRRPRTAIPALPPGPARTPIPPLSTR